MSNKKVVQMLIFALQKKIWKRNIIKSVFDYYHFNSNKQTDIFLFVTQAFRVFIVRICFFLVCNLGLFEITEWESCM